MFLVVHVLSQSDMHVHAQPDELAVRYTPIIMTKKKQQAPDNFPERDRDQWAHVVKRFSLLYKLFNEKQTEVWPAGGWMDDQPAPPLKETGDF